MHSPPRLRTTPARAAGRRGWAKPARRGWRTPRPLAAAPRAAPAPAHVQRRGHQETGHSCRRAFALTLVGAVCIRTPGATVRFSLIRAAPTFASLAMSIRALLAACRMATSARFASSAAALCARSADMLWKAPHRLRSTRRELAQQGAPLQEAFGFYSFAAAHLQPLPPHPYLRSAAASAASRSAASRSSRHLAQGQRTRAAGHLTRPAMQPWAGLREAIWHVHTAAPFAPCGHGLARFCRRRRVRAVRLVPLLEPLRLFRHRHATPHSVVHALCSLS
jgi:hypothetical protein